MLGEPCVFTHPSIPSGSTGPGGVSDCLQEEAGVEVANVPGLAKHRLSYLEALVGGAGRQAFGPRKEPDHL